VTAPASSSCLTNTPRLSTKLIRVILNTASIPPTRSPPNPFNDHSGKIVKGISNHWDETVEEMSANFDETAKKISALITDRRQGGSGDDASGCSEDSVQKKKKKKKKP